MLVGDYCVIVESKLAVGYPDEKGDLSDVVFKTFIYIDILVTFLRFVVSMVEIIEPILVVDLNLVVCEAFSEFFVFVSFFLLLVSFLSD